MTRNDLLTFTKAIEAISVEPPKSEPTETVRPAVLNPCFWFIFATQALMLYMAHSNIHGEQFEQYFFIATGLNLCALISCLLYDKIIIHIYRVAVTQASGASISPLRKAQLRALSQ